MAPEITLPQANTLAETTDMMMGSIDSRVRNILRIVAKHVHILPM